MQPIQTGFQHRDPRVADLINRAQAAWRNGRLDQAGPLFEQAAHLDPKCLPALRGLATAHHSVGRIFNAIDAIKQAIKVAPNIAQLHITLGQFLHGIGDGEGALREYKLAAKLEPKNKTALSAIAGTLEHSNKLEEAEQAVDRALEVAPGELNIVLIRARIARRRKDHEESLRIAREVLDQATDHGIKSVAAFEVARALDKMGDTDGAYEMFALGNAESVLTPRGKASRKSDMRDVADKTRAIPDNIWSSWKAQKPSPDGLTAPVFVCGFPRSGTTMTDQILGAHPDVAILEELPTLSPVLEGLVREVPQGNDALDKLRHLKPDRLPAVRQAYRASVMSMLEAKDRRRYEKGELIVVDKMPLLLGQAAAISRLLPEARFIVVIRDPRDVCFSCFMQAFGLNRSMINFTSMKDSVNYYNNIMNMWLDVRDKVAFDWLEVRYEDMTVDLETQARRMLDFMGAEWNDSVLNFYAPEHRRYVSTPSYEAVTEPVNRKAVGRWLRYHHLMRDEIAQLYRVIGRLGYQSTQEASS